MSTQSNGSNGNGNKPVVEAASADSEVGSAVQDVSHLPQVN